MHAARTCSCSGPTGPAPGHHPRSGHCSPPRRTAVPSTAELPLADCLDTFWLAADRPADAARRPPDPALPGLGRPTVTIRGRNLADLLHPAYEAFTSW